MEDKRGSHRKRYGFVVRGDRSTLAEEVLEQANDARFREWVDFVRLCGAVEVRAKPELLEALGPELDTARIPALLGLKPGLSAGDLDLEILVALSTCPSPIEFGDITELKYGIRVRRNVIQESLKTQLAFSTEEAQRPSAFWDYSEETGFVVRPGQSVIEALRAATQPAITGTKFAFSCYRATEYVVLLAIALELERVSSPLLEVLQRQMEQFAIKSRRFHDVFLREYGSMEEPLPMRFYIPGERVWFRNPDSLSSDVEGYEGSWVFYLGQGHFSNFWQEDQTYTLENKAVELFHWRHGLFVDEEGKGRINENIVDLHVRKTLSDTTLSRAVLERMLRYRDMSGTYVNGGCIDTTREYPRFLGVTLGCELSAS